MPRLFFHGEPDDRDDSDLAGPDAPMSADSDTELTAWPATRFWVDPASSPVLMAAFAWASPLAADVPGAG